ncbi:plastocyanin [Hydrogenophaga sp.]|uniref:cupredoxin domain-containing protein n=1 Tax=Hydrogenophaga sp. TaxID=1904254 RepID=UPI002730FF54|nr:plastocyanin [Hydrogenophaga sp.]MDP2015467.1 plastocyanin [Hydrogenophaga sp.]MDP3166856.1 plastocyanin [Hydrogenophaga sp.]
MNRPNTPAWLIAAVTLLPLVAQAATVQVTVLGRDGKPLAHAVVVIEPTSGARPAAPAPVSAVINQQKMQFVPGTSVLPVGSKVTFTNLDTWEHHVRGMPAGLASLNPGTQPGFELRLDGKAEGKDPASAEVTLSKAGAVQLGCHLHGSMRGFIFVADSPWTLVTDANGVATLQGVPEGAAKVRVVHADQILEAPPVAVNITPVTALSLPTQVQSRRRRP